MDLCSKNATYIGIYIDSILKDGKEEPLAIQNLKDCIEFYSSALEDVQEAMREFSSKYYAEAFNHMNGAWIWADTCKQGFIDLDVDFSLLKKQDNDFVQLIMISTSIIAIIRGPIFLQ
ncbi:uncharacterized protein LOC113345013 [Papaver somniferum]|uniref:uncharacterized protein LOC113345013 n=1 Tax=Papaver somniferum TaxID=3469 RepID=UPI000E705690|nr:uncharacterized protein LOC113345013 [Papaver somniferum]